MALTPKRALLGILVVCAMIATAYLPPEPVVRRQRGPVSSARGRARAALVTRDRAIEQLTLSRRRDSLVVIARQRAAAIPFVVAAPGVQPATRRWFEGRAAELWSALAPPDGGISVGIVVLMDTADVFGVGRRRPFFPEFEYYLPDALDTPACVTVVPLGVSGFADEGDERVRSLRNRRTEALFGPCAFYAMFGRPRGITPWLMNGGGRLAQGYVPERATVRIARGDPWITDVGLAVQSGVDLGRYDPSLFDFQGCLMRRRDRCGSLVSDSGFSGMFVRSSGRTEVPGVLSFGRFALAGESAWFLSDVAATFGREAFASFWQSPLPYDSAFAAAFGVEIEAFVERWMRERFQPPPRGWTIPAASWLISLVTLVVFAGAGAAQAMVRRVV